MASRTEFLTVPAAAVAISDERVDLAGEQINAG
jgi:hypothetical protein